MSRDLDDDDEEDFDDWDLLAAVRPRNQYVYSDRGLRVSVAHDTIEQRAIEAGAPVSLPGIVVQAGSAEIAALLQ